MPADLDAIHERRLRAGYIALLAACAAHAGLRRGHVIDETFSYALTVALSSALWTAWHTPKAARVRIGSVLLVNGVAHLIFWVALWGERLPPDVHCATGLMVFLLFYPVFALLALFGASIAAGVATILVRGVRRLRRERPADLPACRALR